MKNLDYEQLGALVVSVQEGNKADFERLYRLTYDSQYFLASQIMEDPYLAEDVIQDVYIKLLSNIDTIRKPGMLISYLNRMTYNTCISYKRKQYYIVEKPSEDSYLDSLSSTHSYYPEPAEKLMHQETSLELLSFLSLLSDRDRAIFILRYREDMKLKDIALSLECSLSTVKRQLKKIRQLFVEKLGKERSPAFFLMPALKTSAAGFAFESSGASALLNKIMTQPKGFAASQNPNTFQSFLNTAERIKRQQHLKWLLPPVFAFVSILLVLPAALSDLVFSAAEPITVVDTTVPELLSYQATPTTLSVILYDEGSGVNFASIYAVTSQGEVIYPESTSPEQNGITFSLPERPGQLEVYVSDYAGNLGRSIVIIE